MAEHERATQNKQTEVDQKHRVRQKESEPSFDQFYTWDTGPFSLTETPFVPCTDEHVELLAMSPSDEERTDLVLHLQQTYGNKYVQRLIESGAVQAKLTVNTPNDIYEQEADRIADEVVSAEKSQIQRQEEEEEEEELQAQRQPTEEEEEEQVQAQSAEGQPDTVSENIEARINNARGSGRPLSENVREPMEQAFGADFSDVRVHTDSEANLLNQQLSSRAFTTARDIFFRQGEYSPGSDTGKKLIAHELTHVVQQSRDFDFSLLAPDNVDQSKHGEVKESPSNELIQRTYRKYSSSSHYSEIRGIFKDMGLAPGHATPQQVFDAVKSHTDGKNYRADQSSIWTGIDTNVWNCESLTSFMGHLWGYNKDQYPAVELPKGEFQEERFDYRILTPSGLKANLALTPNVNDEDTGEEYYSFGAHSVANIKGTLYDPLMGTSGDEVKAIHQVSEIGESRVVNLSVGGLKNIGGLFSLNKVGVDGKTQLTKWTLKLI